MSVVCAFTFGFNIFFKFLVFDLKIVDIKYSYNFILDFGYTIYYK